MEDHVRRVNTELEATAPALYRALSPLGRGSALAPDILVQSAEAKGTSYNGTIGLITDGRGAALPLPAMAAALPELSAEDRDLAFLYSPVTGLPEARRLWRAWQRRQLDRKEAGATLSSLPLVTCGLSHGLSLIADLFAGEGRAVAIPKPFWGNYREVFELRTGARVLTAPAYREGRYNPRAIEEALADLPPAESALALLNFPSNPGGYSPTDEERAALRASLLRVAETRNLLVVCDDAYAGLVFEEGISPRSMFWDLIGLHENLHPLKVDGTTKEFSFFGGRVGFLTFPVAEESAAARALESKVACLTRATVGSPGATSQVVLLQALRREDVAAQVEAVRRVLEERYRRLREALARVDPELLRPLPFNSGCFALLELPEGLGLSSERVRRHLLEHHDTGLIAIRPRYLRVAHCSVAAEAIPELVRRLETAVRELAAA